MAKANGWPRDREARRKEQVARHPVGPSLCPYGITYRRSDPFVELVREAGREEERSQHFDCFTSGS